MPVAPRKLSNLVRPVSSWCCATAQTERVCLLNQKNAILWTIRSAPSLLMYCQQCLCMDQEGPHLPAFHSNSWWVSCLYSTTSALARKLPILISTRSPGFTTRWVFANTIQYLRPFSGAATWRSCPTLSASLTSRVVPVLSRTKYGVVFLSLSTAAFLASTTW